MSQKGTGSRIRNTDGNWFGRSRTYGAGLVLIQMEMIFTGLQFRIDLEGAKNLTL